MGETISSRGDFSARRARRDGGGEGESTPEGPSVVLYPGPFLHATLVEEATLLDVTVEELVTFAVLYYMTDRDVQRITGGIPPPARVGKRTAARSGSQRRAFTPRVGPIDSIHFNSLSQRQ
jgi:hypothetical protein